MRKRRRTITMRDVARAADREGLKVEIETKPRSDAVNHPQHYNAHPSGVECIAVVEHMTFCVGSAIKYLWRAGLKDSEPTLTDLRKAAWYIAREIERVSKK